MTRRILLPLTPLWHLATLLKNQIYDRRLFTPDSLRNPVISIGSLSAGGAGKTPVVDLLATVLTQSGYNVDILSRGYGRAKIHRDTVAFVRPEGSAEEYGDEPLQLARAGHEVYVASSRLAAGAMAEYLDLPNQIHLLDDGFQHRQLHRTLDIVLLTQADIEDTLLPAGNLREPLPALRRADIVILREEEAKALTPIVRAHSYAEIWIIRRDLLLPPNTSTRPLLFCALARPQNFLDMLTAHGITPAATRFFPDHHPYTEADLKSLQTQAHQTKANGFLTTAKDAVKLPPAFLAQTTTAHLKLTLADPARALRTLRLKLSVTV